MSIQWSTDLATGLKKIDREHEQIHHEIERLVEGIDTDNAAAAACAVVEALKEHVVNHFAHELQQMVELGYPAVEEHQREHAEILAYVISFEEELLADSTEPEILVAATRVLSNWILTHTNTFDRDFARFVRSRA